MQSRTYRRFNGVVGVFLLLLVGGILLLVGPDSVDAPTARAQLVLLALAGTLDVVAAVETPLTDRVPWYRVSGLANVALGLSLPLGFAGTLGEGGLPFFLVTALGGLSIAAIGVDMLAFEGRHVYSESLG